MRNHMRMRVEALRMRFKNVNKRTFFFKWTKYLLFWQSSCNKTYNWNVQFFSKTCHILFSLSYTCFLRESVTKRETVQRAYTHAPDLTCISEKTGNLLRMRVKVLRMRSKM